MLPHSGLPARAGSAYAPPPKDPAFPLTSGRGTASSSALQSAPAVWLAKVEEVRVVAKTLFWWAAVRAWPLQPSSKLRPGASLVALVPQLFRPAESPAASGSQLFPRRASGIPLGCASSGKEAAPRVPRAWRSGKRREQALVPRLPAMDSHRQLDPRPREAPVTACRSGAGRRRGCAGLLRARVSGHSLTFQTDLTASTSQPVGNSDINQT